MSSQPAGSPARPGYPLALLNPLPAALSHYATALAQTLELAGARAWTVPCPSVEVGAGSAGSRVGAAAGLVLARRRAVAQAGAGSVLSLWPSVGLTEPVWWPRSASVWHVVHDPRPLRRQIGYGGTAARVGRLGVGGAAGLIVHARPAADELARLGWPSPVLLPHPMLAADPDLSCAHPGLTRNGLLVLGQHKPVRDMTALRALADQVDPGTPMVIRGRGWPQVDRWQVDSRFVTEAEVEASLSACACLVLPYRRYYASGVAVRCLEQLTPVVGRRHPMLEELLGPDWPGFVKGDQWGAAAARAAAVPRREMVARRDSYAARSHAAWAGFVGALADGARSCQTSAATSVPAVPAVPPVPAVPAFAGGLR